MVGCPDTFVEPVVPKAVTGPVPISAVFRLSNGNVFITFDRPLAFWVGLAGQFTGQAAGYIRTGAIGIANGTIVNMSTIRGAPAAGSVVSYSAVPQVLFDASTAEPVMPFVDFPLALI